MNTFESVDASRLERGATDFEGEDMESRLARRKRNRIGEASIGATRSG